MDRNVFYRESGTDHEVSLKYTYNKKNLITRLDENVNGNTRSTVYTYDGSNRVATIRKGSSRVTYTYDNFSRVTGMVTTHVKTDSSADILREHFTYHDPKAGHTSSLVATYRTEGDGNYDVTYSYTYDNNGNILTVSDGTNTTSYVYDSANQLVRENNQAGGFTHGDGYLRQQHRHKKAGTVLVPAFALYCNVQNCVRTRFADYAFPTRKIRSAKPPQVLSMACAEFRKY